MGGHVCELRRGDLLAKISPSRSHCTEEEEKEFAEVRDDIPDGLTCPFLLKAATWQVWFWKVLSSRRTKSHPPIKQTICWLGC